MTVFSRKPKSDEGGGAARHPEKSTHPPAKEEDAGANLTAQRASKKRSGVSSQDLLQLQRTIGNQAMTNLTQGDKKGDDKNEGDQELLAQARQLVRGEHQAFNVSSDQMLAELLEVTRTENERQQGLVGAQPIRDNEGLLITPCEMIHTRGLAVSIDVVYIDDHNRVVGVDEKLSPNTEGSAYKAVAKVLELPAGTIRRTNTKVGDQLKF